MEYPANLEVAGNQLTPIRLRMGLYISRFFNKLGYSKWEWIYAENNASDRKI